MERQLKERLIGAAVLVAAAVIMVPEMFSGSRELVTPEMDSARPAANQIKTYRVELSSSPPGVAEKSPVEPPAERPLDEAQGMQANIEASEDALPPDEQKPQTAVTQSPRQEAAAAVSPVKPETAKPASAPVTDTRSTAGGWTVQVGSFSAQDKAQQIATRLKGQGFPAFVAAVQVNGKTLYRVRVGAMADRASADATLQKLRGNYPGASVVAPGR